MDAILKSEILTLTKILLNFMEEAEACCLEKAHFKQLEQLTREEGPNYLLTDAEKVVSEIGWVQQFLQKVVKIVNSKIL